MQETRLASEWISDKTDFPIFAAKACAATPAHRIEISTAGAGVLF
jgi:hypothetical protein